MDSLGRIESLEDNGETDDADHAEAEDADGDADADDDARQ